MLAEGDGCLAQAAPPGRAQQRPRRPSRRTIMMVVAVAMLIDDDERDATQAADRSGSRRVRRKSGNSLPDRRHVASAPYPVGAPCDADQSRTAHSGTIVREFTTFAREQRLDLSQVVLPEVLRDLRDLWCPVATSRAIDLMLDLPPRCPPLRADEQKLRRVVENLVRNAIEAIDRGPGRVAIMTAVIPSEETVRIS